MLCHFLKSARTRDKNKRRTKLSHEVTSRLESLERVVPVHDGKGLIPWDEGDEIDAQHLGSHFHSCRHHVQCFLQGLILKCVFKKQYLPSRSIVSAAHLQHGRILMTCSDNVIRRGNFESIMPFFVFSCLLNVDHVVPGNVDLAARVATGGHEAQVVRSKVQVA